MSEANLWVSQLLQRHTRVLANQESPTPSALKALNSLQLADAMLDKVRLCHSHPEHALQLAVIGPTQSGKSTLVNVLLDTDAAGISALAGFTVHAQGFATGYTEQELQLLTMMMTPLQRVPAASLTPGQLEAYVLEPVKAGARALLSPVVIWDTPDFDSIDAGSYRRAVMNTVAIADIVVLMVSKDKYGDKSVWDMLQLIHPLRQPLLVCINKLDPQDEQAVAKAFSRRYSEQLDMPAPPLVLLPFVRRGSSDRCVSLPDQPLRRLQTALETARLQIDRKTVVPAVAAFLARHRDQWLSPLIAEQQAAASWAEMIDAAMIRAADQYARDYLDDPDKYDTFNRALAELLTLLEIPGLAPALMRTRQLVTWPARKLLGLGRLAVSRQLDPAGHAVRSAKPEDQEAETLERILDTTLTNLQGTLLDQPHQPYWSALTQALRHQEERIRSTYLNASLVVQKEFEPQVEAAARRLYEQLQAQPALLNTLRAARVTADAAGIALALKSGGLAPADLVLAPAMLSVTTLLTESALGKYLDSIKVELKERQRQHVHSQLLYGVLAAELTGLSLTLADENLFAQQLEPELLAQVVKEQ